ncbi:Alpha/Beta hydrolase protein, partial [Mycena vulgaris]
QVFSKGPACPQQSGAVSPALIAIINNPILNILAVLTSAIGNLLNLLDLGSSTEPPPHRIYLFCSCVSRPLYASKDANQIPQWIYGGGFQFCSTRDNDGTTVRVIYVAANNRLNAFGFLGGKAASTGNLGLQDQGLFRGAVMESGSVIPTQDDIAGQPYYDPIMNQTGCTNASDTLACLRTVPYQTLLAAVNQTPSAFSYMSLKLPFGPWTDGVFLTENAQDLLANGEFTKHQLCIAFINVSNRTTLLFSLSNSNITTSGETLEYMKLVWFPDASDDQIATIGTLYPDDLSMGSPFNTGILNALTPEYKRLAAFQGDVFFHAPRKNMLSVTDGAVSHWSCLYVRGKATPILGASHGTAVAEWVGIPGGLLNLPGDFQGTDCPLNFVNNLDPSVFSNPSTAAAAMSSTIFWPQYTAANETLLTFQDGLAPLALTRDDFRSAPIAFLEALSWQFPW